MEKMLWLTAQAQAAFRDRDVWRSICLIRDAWEQFEASEFPLMSNSSYNAALDLLAMLEVLLEVVPVLESTAYIQSSLKGFRTFLETDERGNFTKAQFDSEKAVITQLIQGVWAALDFFQNNRVELMNPKRLFSIGLENASELHLYQYQEHDQAYHLIEAFEACFFVELITVEDFDQAIQTTVNEGEMSKAQDLLKELMEKHPKEKQRAFLQSAELYLEAAVYDKAVDAYMKAVVFGASKASIKEAVQLACNRLISSSENNKVAKPWQELLINFF